MQHSKPEKDPVCGMSVNSKDCQHKTQHKNKNYSFCCQECLKTFKDNPEKYSHK